ncbi:signal peptidase I [soil metagenome]
MFKRLSGFFLDILQVIIFAVSIFLFVYLLVLQPHKINGESMESNFHDAEYILTEKVTYYFNSPKRGDVIVFKAPPDGHDEYIKRIIGLPGDTVMVQNCKVYVNGNMLTEKYLPENLCTNPGDFATEGVTLTVPADHYFVMGDNRPHSLDSRFQQVGFIGKDKFTGRAWIVYWPLNNAEVVKAVSY